METTVLSFKLTNNADHPVLAVLIGAPVKLKSALAGRVLKAGTIKAETGDDTITVSGLALDADADLQEFIEHYDISVVLAKLKSGNMNQACINLQEKTYEMFKTAVGIDIPTECVLGNGADKGKIIHAFQTPFRALPNKSLILPLEAKGVVDVELVLSVPTLQTVPSPPPTTTTV